MENHARMCRPAPPLRGCRPSLVGWVGGGGGRSKSAISWTTILGNSWGQTLQDLEGAWGGSWLIPGKPPRMSGQIPEMLGALA